MNFTLILYVLPFALALLAVVVLADVVILGLPEVVGCLVVLLVTAVVRGFCVVVLAAAAVVRGFCVVVLAAAGSVEGAAVDWGPEEDAVDTGSEGVVSSVTVPLSDGVVSSS